jgi:hypothetical protein
LTGPIFLYRLAGHYPPADVVDPWKLRTIGRMVSLGGGFSGFQGQAVRVAASGGSFARFFFGKNVLWFVAVCQSRDLLIAPQPTGEMP